MPFKTNPVPDVFEAIRKAIYMFRDNPCALFTHTDFASYMYHRLHACELEVRIRDVRIQCVHREYPTNFRFKEKDLRSGDPLPENAGDIMELDNAKAGTRGIFDLVVLRPAFVRHCIEEAYKRHRIKDFADPRDLFLHIVNKDIKLLKMRRDLAGPFAAHAVEREILFAFQLSLVTELTEKALEDIRRNNLLLSLASRPPSEARCVHLIFCNVQMDKPTTEQTAVLRSIMESVGDAPEGVLPIFVHSWFSRTLQINSGRPLINRNAPQWSKELLEKLGHKSS